jgi:dephospho-CoA kinase
VSKTIQMDRIKSRKTMEYIEIKRILDQQMPIEEKSKLADFVIETFNKRDTEKQVLNIIKKIESNFNA